MDWFLVMTGGALGAGGRYGVGRVLGGVGYDGPWPTLAVNLIGGLAMGLVTGMLLRSGSEHWRLFLAVGVLGGFTTFSSFGLDTVRMIELGQNGAALGYVLASVILTLLLTLLGLAVTRP